MKKSTLALIAAGLLMSGPADLWSQEGSSPEVQDLRKQIELLQQQLQMMQERLTNLEQRPAPPASADPAASMARPALNEPDLMNSVLAPPSGAAPSTRELLQKPWRPSDPLRFQRANAFMDIGLTGTAVLGSTTAEDSEDLLGGGHDPAGRGFTLQGLEANFYGEVDPYLRGSANLLFALNQGGESFLEVEEAWLESTALPGNLQLRAGQMFSEIGRQNSQHLHSWQFTDRALVHSRFMGPDGLRNVGARLSWLVPTPFYSELFLGVQNSGGATANSFRGGGQAHQHGAAEEGHEEEEEIPFGFRHFDNDRGVSGLSDMLITPRYAMSWDLTPNQTLLWGASAAIGPNNSGGAGKTDTFIYGTDLTWKWRSPKHDGGYPFVALQTEFLRRDYQAGFFDWDEDANGGDGDGDGSVDEGIVVDPLTGLPAILPEETLADQGFYTQLTYGFRRGWVAGLRLGLVNGLGGDYENRGLIVADGTGGGAPVGFDANRQSRWRLSPNLTWYPTEYSKIRLQYNYDNRELQGVDHSVWLQFEFILGSHAAHNF